MHVSPSVNKMSPGVMEMVLKFPCGMKSATITLEFDKGFLHIDEYPPDANQGFDIPSAIISFPNFHTSMQFFKDKSVEKSSILSKFQENSDVLTYTEVLLVLLATPDFSLPGQVMVITIIVCLKYFSYLLEIVRRRAGEEENFQRTEFRLTVCSILIAIYRFYNRAYILTLKHIMSCRCCDSIDFFLHYWLS